MTTQRFVSFPESSNIRVVDFDVRRAPHQLVIRFSNNAAYSYDLTNLTGEQVQFLAKTLQFGEIDTEFSIGKAFQKYVREQSDLIPYQKLTSTSIELGDDKIIYSEINGKGHCAVWNEASFQEWMVNK